MAYNDHIKKEQRELYKQKRIDNKKFIIVSGGKFGRSVLRKKAAKEIREYKSGLKESPIGKVRSRQERKKMAKALGVPFQPRYNGPSPLYIKYGEKMTNKSSGELHEI